MGNYQTFRGNPEHKLFYLVDQLIGGINTDFSDDVSPDNEFKSIINFNMDKRGSLYKRMGFGKLTAVSEILNLYTDLPITKGKTPEDPYPEETNDNIVYMKMLRNDNNCFRNLSAFVGEKAYREYQSIYGNQNNTFELLIITTSKHTNTSTAWLYKCTLPPLEYDENNQPTSKETIQVSHQVYDLPVVFKWDRNLCNIETVEYFDKIYFTGNDKGLVVFDRTTETFSYNGTGIPNQANQAYKPNAMEIRKVGFNLLGDDPLHWVDFQGLTTDSIQGVYITTMEDKPALVIPSGGQFRLNVLYTGGNNGFGITFKEGEATLAATIADNASKSTTGLRVYDVTLKTVPTSEVEIKVTKTSASIDPYYDYYEVGQVDPETKVVKALNIGDCGILEMYNRAVYYKGDTIWFSEINTFNYVPNYNYVSLPIEPTDEITKIVFFRNVYIIFTKFRIYKMVGSFGSTDFEVIPVNLSIGCHAPNTVIPVENELYFASKRGLYALKSSDFREGIENLKELDTKIKQVTADVTMYLGERTDPAVRYNGISDRAYAVRYKDKYMLFFNTAYEQGDLAALVNVDALVYQYELKAFSEIKFPIKPTYLFMVDGAIETFCTVKEKEEYTEEQTLLEYNFEALGQNATVAKDLSGNGLDANLLDNLTIAPGTGLTLNGTNIKIGAINSNVNLAGGFTIEMDALINSLNGAKILSIKQSNSTGYSKSDSFSIYTDWSNGYRGELICTTSPNQNNLVNQINWKFRWHRDSTSRNAASSGKFGLKVGSTNLISERDFNFNFGSALYQDIASGSFSVNHDSAGNYSQSWKLSTSSKYPTYSTGWDKGATTYFDVTQSDSWTSHYGIKLVGRAEAYNGGARVIYTPYFWTSKYGSIYVGYRTMDVWVNGVKKTHDIGSISHDQGSEATFSFGEKYVDIDYTGNKTIFIDACLYINMSFNGVQQNQLNIAGFNFALPKVTSYTITTWNDFSMSGTTTITLTRILKPSYREISINISGVSDKFQVSSTSEYGSSSDTTNGGMGIVGRHKWKFVFTKGSSNYSVDVYRDGNKLDTLYLTANTVVNGDRDVNYILDGLDGNAYSYKMYLSSGSYVFGYDFTEGQGLNLTDTTGNGRTGVLNSKAEWLTEKGLAFNGKNGYVSLPRLDDVMFSNGFIIEFEAKLNTINQTSKFFDFAMSYDSGDTSAGKSSINAGTSANTNKLDFMTTSVDYKTYKVSKSNADLTTRAKWRIVCKDVGDKYELTLYRNDVEVAKNEFNYGGITNVIRKSNFIGKSNNPKDGLLDGMVYNFKVILNASANPVPIYIGSMYEYDTTYDDFGRAMEVEIETKGINLQYPLHTKKLKNIIVKGLGGYNYGSFFFEVYSDGHLVNDPKVYNCYVDEVTRQVVYDYEEVKSLSFNEMMSLLGNMRLGYTKLGTSTYETRKMVVPAKGKNFTIKLYGESKDFLSIESFGFVFKLGKVKES